jgi:hypothetical protein
VSLGFVFRELNADNDSDTRNRILAVIGELIGEGKVERATLSGYYKAVTNWAV